MLLLFLVGAGAVAVPAGHPGRMAPEELADRARRAARERDAMAAAERERATLREDEELALLLAAGIPRGIA